MRKFVTMLPLILVLAVTSLTQASEGPEGERLPDVQILARAPHVILQVDGASYVLTKEQAAFRALCRQGTAAREDALYLVECGTPAGRIYGFALLARIDRLSAETLLARSESTQATVRVGIGCVVLNLPFAQLAQDVVSWRYPVVDGILHN